MVTIWDTLAHFVVQLFILMGMSGGVESGRECEAAHRSGAGMRWCGSGERERGL